MEADIFKPELWTEFFLLVGTGAVTLTGLVFVALSLNLKTIAIDTTHRFRAIGTLTGLAAVFMRCSLVLMGGQGHIAVGAELATVALLAAAVYVAGFVRATRSGNPASLSRTITGTSLYLTEIIGAIILISGSIAGLYVAAIAMVASTCYMITGAWLLVMGVYADTAKSPRR